MKEIKTGNWYFTRRGDRVYICGTEPNGLHFVGLIYDGAGSYERTFMYNPRGTTLRCSDNNYDLVLEPKVVETVAYLLKNPDGHIFPGFVPYEASNVVGSVKVKLVEGEFVDE